MSVRSGCVFFFSRVGFGQSHHGTASMLKSTDPDTDYRKPGSTECDKIYQWTRILKAYFGQFLSSPVNASEWVFGFLKCWIRMRVFFSSLWSDSANLITEPQLWLKAQIRIQTSRKPGSTESDKILKTAVSLLARSCLWVSLLSVGSGCVFFL